MQRPKLLAPAALLFAALAIYFAIWVFQGIDMTDEGHHLANQLMFTEGRTEYPFGMLWLTYGLGGVWLRAFGGGLLAARAAWVLTMSLTGLTTFLILARHARRLPAALAAAAAALACTHHGNMVINQNNLPFLLLLVSAGLLLAADAETAPGRRRVLALGSGAALGLAIMARFPLMVGLGLLLVPPAARYLQLRQVRRGTWTNAGWALMGVAASAGAALAGLAAAGHFRSYAHALAGQGFKEEYTVAGLLTVYADSSVHALRAVTDLLIEAVPWAIGLHVLCRALRIGRWAPALLGVIGMWWLGATARRVGIDALHWEYFHLLPGIAMLTGAVLFCAALWRGARDEATARRQVLLAVAAALPVLITAGTNNGIINMTHGLWLLIPVGALFAPAAAASLAGGPDAGLRVRRTASAYAVTVAAVLAIASGSFRFVNPYRDTRARWKLTTAIDAPRLRGVYTTEGRAASLRALLGRLAEHTRPGDRLLAYGGMPMVHFATDTLPALDNPWPECIGLADLKQRLAAMLERGHRPVSVVKAVTDMSSGRWGSKASVLPARAGLDKARFEAVEAAVAAMGYRPAWSNADFVILLPPTDGGGQSGGVAPEERSGTTAGSPAH